MRKPYSTIILVSLFLISALTMVTSVKVSPEPLATVTGRVLYNGRPISEFTTMPAVFWAFNESSGQAFTISPSYNPSNGVYSIPNIPPGEHIISVYVDAAEPFNGQIGLAGDFEWTQYSVIVPEGQSVVYQDLPVKRIIHLTSPVDNRAEVGYVGGPKDTYLLGAVVFRWDAIPEAAGYRVRITEYEEEPFRAVRGVLAVSTSNVSLKPNLPVSGENRFYMFDLSAVNSDGVEIAYLWVAYSNGYGFDYRFRIKELLLSILSPVNGSYSKSSAITVTWSASDSSIDHYEVKLDGGSWVDTGTTASHTFLGISDGSHMINVKAVDRFGNVKEAFVSFVINTSLIGGPGWIDDAALFGLIIVAVLGAITYAVKRKKKFPLPPPPPPS